MTCEQKLGCPGGKVHGIENHPDSGNSTCEVLSQEHARRPACRGGARQRCGVRLGRGCRCRPGGEMCSGRWDSALLRLHWAFPAGRALPLQRAGFSCGFCPCRAPGRGLEASVVVTHRLSCCQGPSRIPRTGWWVLTHRTTKEVPEWCLL